MADCIANSGDRSYLRKQKLPELARALGKAKGEFKKGTAEGEALLKEEEEKSKELERKKSEAEKA